MPEAIEAVMEDHLVDMEAGEAELEISPVVSSQVKLIKVTEARVYPLVIQEDFKAVLISGIIQGIPEAEIVLRQQQVMEVMNQENTEDMSSGKH